MISDPGLWIVIVCGLTAAVLFGILVYAIVAGDDPEDDEW